MFYDEFKLSPETINRGKTNNTFKEFALNDYNGVTESARITAKYLTAYTASLARIASDGEHLTAIKNQTIELTRSGSSNQAVQLLIKQGKKIYDDYTQLQRVAD